MALDVHNLVYNSSTRLWVPVGTDANGNMQVALTGSLPAGTNVVGAFAPDPAVTVEATATTIAAGAVLLGPTIDNITANNARAGVTAYATSVPAGSSTAALYGVDSSGNYIGPLPDQTTQGINGNAVGSASARLTTAQYATRVYNAGASSLTVRVERVDLKSA